MEMKIVAALFVRADSIYKTLPDVDCYDAERDAKTWRGGCPVVAHPPCRTWGRLRHFAKAPAHEHALGPWAVEQVRRWGGVLEHPQGSRLFAHCGCALPGGLIDEWGGMTLQIDQFHWGHKARKRTFLYIVGTRDFPAMPNRIGQPTHVIDGWGTGRRLRRERGLTNLPAIQHWEREATPSELAVWLVELARRCERDKRS